MYSVIYICVYVGHLTATFNIISSSLLHRSCFSSALHCLVSRTSTNLEMHSLRHGAKVSQYTIITAVHGIS